MASSFTEQLTLRAGAKVFASDGAYVGAVQTAVVFAANEPLTEREMAICGSPVIGGDFRLNGGWIKSASIAQVLLSCDFGTVLRHATLEFQWGEGAIVGPETRAHRAAAQIIEAVNRQTFDLIRKVRTVRHDAVSQFGALSPAEEALIQRITDLEMAAIDTSVQAALAHIGETTREVG